MPWTDITRAEHSRRFDRYPSDLTDAEWAVISPLVPPARPVGRPRTSDMREVMNAILYISGGGIAWRMLPKDLPPVSTVRGCLNFVPVSGQWGTLPLSMKGAPNGTTATEVDRRL